MSDITRKIKQINLYFWVTSLCIVALIFACTNNDKNDAPVIVSLSTPDFIPIGFTETIYFRLTVDDNQGLDDIDTVYFVIINPDSTVNPDTAYMYDDGENGDVTDGDGIYTYAATLDNTPQENGFYTYRFAVKDSKGKLSENLDKVIEIDVHPKPYIFNLTTPDSIQIGIPDTNVFTLQVSDPQGLSDVDIVYFTIEDSLGTVCVDTSFMFDNGNGRDEQADDGIYTCLLDGYSYVTTGSIYIFRYNAVDLSSNISNQIIDTVSTGDRPYIFDLVAPDSLEKGSSSAGFLSVRAWDPQGAGNIDVIYFTAMRPDSSTSGTRFYMYDDGEIYVSGDSVANDGIYSTGIQPPGESSQSGIWTFDFTGFDNENNQANVLSVGVQVYDPANTNSSNLREYIAAGKVPNVWK